MRASRSQQHTLVLCSLLMLGLMLIPLGGCGSSKSIVRGRVIAGNVGQAVAAASGDERFQEPGLADMKVSVLAKGGSSARGRGVYASAVSDEFGNFELAFLGGSFPRDVVEFRVSGEGIFTARSQMYMPKEGDQVLCVVITRPGYSFKEQNRQPDR